MATALGAKPAAGRQRWCSPIRLDTRRRPMSSCCSIRLYATTVLADDAMRQVVVTGSADTQAQVKAAIDQIDHAGKSTQPPNSTHRARSASHNSLANDRQTDSPRSDPLA
ncbi:MAG: hypothetical protein R3C56_10325 [Pirellulaceae bacterium]